MIDELAPEDRLYQLIALILNADACSERLDELRTERAATQEMRDEYQATLETVAKERDEIEQIKGQAEELKQSAERWSAQLKAKELELNEALGVLHDREQAIIAAVSDLKDREMKAGERETTLEHREILLADREKHVLSHEERAEALLASYDAAKHQAMLALAANGAAESVS